MKVVEIKEEMQTVLKKMKKWEGFDKIRADANRWRERVGVSKTNSLLVIVA